LQNGAMIRSN